MVEAAGVVVVVVGVDVGVAVSVLACVGVEECRRGGICCSRHFKKTSIW